MWPFRKRPQPSEHDVATAVNVKERVTDLEDAIEHLNRRFARLQQQVTRWAREYDDELDDDGDGDEFDNLLAKKREARG
jgi:hypothetical protein